MSFMLMWDYQNLWMVLIYINSYSYIEFMTFILDNFRLTVLVIITCSFCSLNMFALLSVLSITSWIFHRLGLMKINNIRLFLSWIFYLLLLWTIVFLGTLISNVNQEVRHRLVYRPTWCRHFLDLGFIFPDDSRLCQINKKIISVWLYHKQTQLSMFNHVYLFFFAWKTLIHYNFSLSKKGVKLNDV